MLDPTQPQNPEPTTAPTQTLQSPDALLQSADTSKKTSVWGYVIWGLSLPPISTILALLIALKGGTFNIVLPSITIAFSVLSVISPIATYFLFGGAAKGITASSMLLTIVAIIGIILGIYFRKRAKQTLALGGAAVAALVLILILEHVIVLQDLTSAVNDTLKQTQTILNQPEIPY